MKKKLKREWFGDKIAQGGWHKQGFAPPPAKRLGDRVHDVLGPIGRAIHWPCLKGDGSTDLKPKSLCGYIRQTLNRIP